MGQDTSPRRFDTFLTWVRRWDKVYFQLFDNQAFQARAKHLTILPIVFNCFNEQMFNISRWIIDTFLLFRLEPNWNWTQGVWNCRNTANSKFPCTSFVLYSHTGLVPSKICNAIVKKTAMRQFHWTKIRFKLSAICLYIDAFLFSVWIGPSKRYTTKKGDSLITLELLKWPLGTLPTLQLFTEIVRTWCKGSPSLPKRAMKWCEHGEYIRRLNGIYMAEPRLCCDTMV